MTSCGTSRPLNRAVGEAVRIVSNAFHEATWNHGNGSTDEKITSLGRVQIKPHWPTSVQFVNHRFDMRMAHFMRCEAADSSSKRW
jgi:hypothetical protein